MIYRFYTWRPDAEINNAFCPTGCPLIKPNVLVSFLKNKANRNLGNAVSKTYQKMQVDVFDTRSRCSGLFRMKHSCPQLQETQVRQLNNSD